MGTDIHVAIIRDGEFVTSEFDLGRNYSWFDKIQTEEDEYAYLKWHYDADDHVVPQQIRDLLNERGYYGFKYVSVPDFISWFEKYHPDLDAGWVSTYSKWKWEKKHIAIDEDDVYHYLPEDVNKDDYVFMEFSAWDDSSALIIDNIPLDYMTEDDVYLVFYFDS
jgi:hypothetical protein